MRRVAGREEAALLVRELRVQGALQSLEAVLDRLGLIENAQYVERATMSGQRILKLRDVPTDGAPYFSMILVRHGETEAGI